MELVVVGTGSKGNAYVLRNEDEALLIECGMKMDVIKKAFNFDLSKIVGCIVTHEHGDHAKSILDVMLAGIDVYATEGTFRKTMFAEKSHRQNTITERQKFKLGGFTILPFKVMHDAAQPVGFIINHKDMGNCLFLTDTYYSPFKFANLNQIIIEANFSQEKTDRQIEEGTGNTFLRNRILKSHLSLENCLEICKVNDMAKVNNIVLIHLSDSNSDEIRFKKAIEDETGKKVTVACNNLTIPFGLRPF